MNLIDSVIDKYNIYSLKIEKLPSNFFSEQYLNDIESDLRDLAIYVAFLEHQEINYFLYLLKDFIERIRKQIIFLDYLTLQSLTEAVQGLGETFELIKKGEESYLIKIKIRTAVGNYERSINQKQEVVFINNSIIFEKADEVEWILESINSYRHLENNKKISFAWQILKRAEDVLVNVKMAKFNKNFKKIKSYFENVTLENMQLTVKEEYYLGYIRYNLERLFEYIKTERVIENVKDIKIEVCISDLEKLAHTTEDKNTAKNIELLYLSDVKEIIREFEGPVKEIGKSNGKEVIINILGELKIYKIFKEKIKFALMHLLRNCVDHGIESTIERAKNGKPEIGEIRINLEMLENKYSIKIGDDGKGIDTEKILAKAIEKGFLSHEDIKLVNEEEIISYIFYPDFSTSDKVSEISGRGVGMDVVRKNIEDIGGTITIRTEKNKGTLFEISIPKEEVDKYAYSCQWG